jgi:hypothetical protein
MKVIPTLEPIGNGDYWCSECKRDFRIWVTPTSLKNPRKWKEEREKEFRDHLLTTHEKK